MAVKVELYTGHGGAIEERILLSGTHFEVDEEQQLFVTDSAGKQVAIYNENAWRSAEIDDLEEKYPYMDGDIQVLGPGTIFDPRNGVINYRGENYYLHNPAEVQLTKPRPSLEDFAYPQHDVDTSEPRDIDGGTASDG